jgi:hypothetical protein
MFPMNEDLMPVGAEENLISKSLDALLEQIRYVNLYVKRQSVT